MYTIETLNSISPKGLARLPASLFQIVDEEHCEAPQGILVRSADMLEAQLPGSLLAIARAGAGTNNIPIERCTEKGIVVFNTPGANANAVKELVLGGLVLASRNVAGGMEWLQGLKGEGEKLGSLVEKGKNKFAGPELEGKTLGVIGLGAIGVKVANMATHLHMEVLGYDPYISVESAWNLSRSVIHSVTLSEVIHNADYITLHMPVNDSTRGIINKETLAQMKQGARILNFARGELVDTAALVAALRNGRIACYVTDFPDDALIGEPGVVCIPHLGASTPESEENCAVMAADQLREYLLIGNIVNSVNLPDVNVPKIGGGRICVSHQ
ncbi:MAG: 3-phosphoglycerate dehydrogenase, partial [Oscillospiraceae bacterium]